MIGLWKAVSRSPPNTFITTGPDNYPGLPLHVTHGHSVVDLHDRTVTADPTAAAPTF